MGIFSLVKVALSVLVAVMVALGSWLTGSVSVQAPSQTHSEAAAFPSAGITSSTSTVATASTSSAPLPAHTAAKPAAPIVPQSQTIPASTPSSPVLPSDQLNTFARASVVNILCTTVSGGSFHPISGSGVVVDNRGVILTNAHVAQYFLLRDYPTPNNVQCVVRTGSPAEPRYTAELLYLPPAWIAANASQITNAEPTGTGENDYAFLRITGAAGTQTLPASFPALPMDAAAPDTGEQMLLAAYPAGFLGGVTISTSLYLSSAPATVGQLYTFSGAQQVDLFSLGGSVVSQAGSSGGAVVSQDGKLRGIIVTELLADTTSGRDLRALSLGHIDRSLASQGQGGIAQLLTGDLAAKASAFNANTAPAETQALEEALAGK